jgi:trehalose 6-phosphate synthase
VLSRFAGAAHELGNGALLVNPYDVESIAEALARAVSMPLQERRERLDGMARAIRDNTVFEWCRTYLDELISNTDHEAGSPLQVA